VINHQAKKNYSYIPSCLLRKSARESCGYNLFNYFCLVNLITKRRARDAFVNMNAYHYRGATEDNELLVLFCKVYGIILSCCVLLIDALAEEDCVL
jgi:hypothetical protein